MANTARNKPQAEKITVVESNPLEGLAAKYENNKNRINTIVGIVLALVVGFFAYQKLYKEPREAKAAVKMAYPQSMFEIDSFANALNGDGQHPGFLKIQKQYGNTASANLTYYYAGISYLKMGDFQKAIKQLEQFDGKGTQVGYAAYGVLGDAYMEAGNVKKGIENYNKAAGNEKDEVITPLYLYRAGVAYEMNNQPEEAKKAYIRIRDNYPQSLQARDVARNLARLGVLD